MHITRPCIRAPFLGITPETPAAADAGPAPQRQYTSREIFGQGQEVSILHRGERYTLRITRQAKLILTK